MNTLQELSEYNFNLLFNNVLSDTKYMYTNCNNMLITALFAICDFVWYIDNCMYLYYVKLYSPQNYHGNFGL